MQGLVRKLSPLAVAVPLLFGAVSPAQAQVASLTAGEHQAIVNDVRLWYRAAGPLDAQAYPVVFLHGGPGQGSQTFARFAGPLLEAELPMVYLDQRGSGRSERPWTHAYSMDLLIEDIEQLRRQWGVEKISVIGHSFGTILALEYAARYPQHTHRVVLAAAAPDLPAAMEGQCDRLERIAPDTYARVVAERPEGFPARCNAFAAGREFVDSAMYPDPAIMTRVDETDAEGGLSNTGEMGGALMGQGLMTYAFRETARLTMPVQIIAGAEDYQTGVGPQRALAQALPDARMLEYEGRGHFMFVEEPERFARDVIGFLKN